MEATSRWTHKGSTEAEISELRQHDGNGGYPDTERPMEMKEMLVARRKQSDTEINTHVSGNIGVPICEGLSPTACCWVYH